MRENFKGRALGGEGRPVKGEVAIRPVFIEGVIGL